MTLGRFGPGFDEFEFRLVNIGCCFKTELIAKTENPARARERMYLVEVWGRGNMDWLLRWAWRIVWRTNEIKKTVEG